MTLREALSQASDSRAPNRQGLLVLISLGAG